MKELHPIERCLQHPPLEGSYGPSSLDLCIHDTIHIGDEHHAQVVVVEVLTANSLVEGLSQGELVVAKPLYVFDENLYIHPFVAANKHHTHDVATYEVLSDFQDFIIPEYYGPYSQDAPIDSATKRCARLTLRSPWTATTSSPKNHETLVELDTWAFGREIILVDVHPRNIMLTQGDYGSVSRNTTHTFQILDPDTEMVGVVVPGGFEYPCTYRNKKEYGTNIMQGNSSMPWARTYSTGTNTPYTPASSNGSAATGPDSTILINRNRKQNHNVPTWDGPGAAAFEVLELSLKIQIGDYPVATLSTGDVAFIPTKTSHKCWTEGALAKVLYEADQRLISGGKKWDYVAFPRC